MTQRADILLITGSESVKRIFTTTLTSNGFRLITMDSVLEAKALVERRRFDLIVVDGIASETKELLFQAKAQNPHIKSLLVSEDTGVEEVLKSLDHEIIGCVFKPLRESEVRFEVNRILSSNLTSREMTHRAEKFVFNQSRNPQMAALYQSAVDKIAKSDSTVLIQGESGTGKELMATWIYSHSLRKNRPFVKVSCAVLPEGILESELFGHERGSFTGAYTKRKGRFEVADGGTIFLDEIGEISPSIQSKFLRVLQEREFQRVGGSASTIKVDVRVIAATSRNLRKEVELGRFREDLFYRLNVISLNIPPLRKRKEDIPHLVKVFLHKFCLKSQKRILEFSDSALRLLQAYDWPGNVRELENVVERAVVMSSGDIITIDDLPTNIVQLLAEEIELDTSLRSAREKFEEEYLKETLLRFKGNISQSAKYLGLARKNLQEKIKKYRISASKLK